MLFFCPVEANRPPIATTMAEQVAILTEGKGIRQMQGLVVDAPSPRAADGTLTAYLLDCHRSGRAGYRPTVDMGEHGSVLIASLPGKPPSLSLEEAAAVASMRRPHRMAVTEASTTPPAPARIDANKIAQSEKNTVDITAPMPTL